jgi:hypothetical protein
MDVIRHVCWQAVTSHAGGLGSGWRMVILALRLGAADGSPPVMAQTQEALQVGFRSRGLQGHASLSALTEGEVGDLGASPWWAVANMRLETARSCVQRNGCLSWPRCAAGGTVQNTQRMHLARSNALVVTQQQQNLVH